MSERTLTSAFDQFERGDERLQCGSHGNLGVGLSFVKRIIELHGGCIQAVSGGPGSGSVFTVKIPAACTC